MQVRGVCLLAAGAIVSLAWLAVGFNLASIYSPRVAVHEAANQNSVCDSYK